MKRLRHRWSRGLAASLALLLLLGICCERGLAQVPRGPIRGFTIPFLEKETFKLKARLRGEEAELVGQNLQVRGAKVEIFGEGGRGWNRGGTALAG